MMEVEAYFILGSDGIGIEFRRVFKRIHNEAFRDVMRSPPVSGS